jgi:anaerobic selenocysteine-containing dehydrogenase
VLDAAGRHVVLLLDGNLPCEQLAAAVAWTEAWPQADLCLVLEPAEHELLAGADASGAEALSLDDLAGCDGFLIVGDALAANPRCARGVLDRHRDEPKSPIVAISPGGGAAAKFATHPFLVKPGEEIAALAALARAAGVTGDLVDAAARDVAGAETAGAALAGCSRLGVLLAAEYGRNRAWRAVGALAGQLAKACGGGLAVQTTGANALAAVRTAEQRGTVPLARALAARGDARVVIGCDPSGMLGRDDLTLLAAAAALPNESTAAADFVLPLAMPGEYGGTYLLENRRPVAVETLLPPPAGVRTPAEWVEALARAAGVAEPELRAEPAVPEPLVSSEPSPAVASDPTPPVLAFARSAAHSGSGALTGHGSWQAGAQPLPDLAVSPADAEARGLKHLGEVTVRTEAGQLRARVRRAPDVPPGTMVLPEGLAAARALAPTRADGERDELVCELQTVQVDG